MKLTELFHIMWRKEAIPQEFKDASIIHLFKQKGNPQLCDNHRGISLLLAHIRLCSDCASASADLHLHWVHISEDTFPDIADHLQSTLVISNSKGLSEILRDIRTSTYQICRIKKKIIPLTTFNKYMCNLTPEVRDILKILWKRGFLLFSTICFTCCSIFVFRQGPDFHFEISGYFRLSEFEITRVNCIVFDKCTRLQMICLQ